MSSPHDDQPSPRSLRRRLRQALLALRRGLGRITTLRVERIGVTELELAEDLHFGRA